MMLLLLIYGDLRQLVATATMLQQAPSHSKAKGCQGPRPKAEGRRLEAGGWRPEAGGRRPETQGHHQLLAIPEGFLAAPQLQASILAASTCTAYS